MSLGPNAVFAAQMHQMPEVLEDFPYKVPFLHELPVYRVPGNSLRTATVPKFDSGNFADIVPFCDEITDRTRQPQPREHQFAEIGTSVEVCYTAQDRNSFPNDQLDEQGKLSKHTTLYQYCQMYDTGVSGPGSFAGLAAQVDPSKLTLVGGAVATLAQWQRMRMAIDTNDGWNPIVMGNEDAYLAFLAANNILGFKPDYMDHACPDGRGGWIATRVACLEGAKFLLNACIPNRVVGPNIVTNVYCLQPGAAGGNQGGVFGIMPAGMTNWFTRRETIIPGKSRVYVDWTLTAGLVVASKGAVTSMRDIRVGVAVA